jgi:hypothetical protein
VKTKEQILSFILANEDTLRKQFHITKIGIFGSVARDEQHDTSDLDLLVEFEPGTAELYDLKQGIRDFFNQSLNIEVDICREKYIKPAFKDSILQEAFYAY